MDQETQRLQLKKLIIQGKEQGFLTYRDINDHLPEGVHDTDQIEAVINRLVEEKFQVRGASRRWPRARGCAHTLARARAPAGVCAHPRQALRSAVPPLPGGSE